jgi:PAS domain S-box-containing protein
MLDQTGIGGSAETRDPEAVQFLSSSGLPLSSVILSLFDQSDDCIKLIDRDGRLKFMNCNGRQAMEVDDFAVVEGCAWPSRWPEESCGLIQQAVEQALTGKLTRFEAYCPTAKGTPKWWEVTVSPIHGANGSVAAILSSSRDVTQRKIHEDALAAVAAEMKHRLRNAYTVGAAVSLAMARDDPAHRDFANQLASRLVSLGGIQSALVDYKDVSLVEIVARTVRAFRGDEQSLRVEDLPGVRLDEQGAKTLVLVLGELATNSLKYGALSGRGTATITASADGGHMVLNWTEVHHVGPGPQSIMDVPSGTGHQLMGRMLAISGGKIETRAWETGYSAIVTMRV